MRSRHNPRDEVTYKRRYVGKVEYFTSRYSHGDASMVVYRFARAGDRSGPDFVLVHGIGVSARSYGPTAVALAQHGDVYLLDLPGYGRSPRPDHDLSIAGHAQVVGDFLTDRELDHPVVVGHSMGTQVVVEMAAEYPDQLDHIALIAPVIVPSARTVPKVAGLFLQNAVKEPPQVGLMAVYDYLVRAGVPYMMQQTKHLLGNHLEEVAPRVDAKTLVICGEDDAIVPIEWGRELAGRFPHGWFASVPGPHATMFAAPESIAGLLDEHAHR
ncbi:MAG TPA: alpha/beta hydrolase [Propionicimonas sp.]|nr:alpha/beta hydrolase [Propionicimonas sp.]HRA06313.1 alpha/beta hydrolase [Propionicimonas sp.]